MATLSPQLRSVRDTATSFLSEAWGWVSSELHASVSAYAPAVSTGWCALLDSHQALSSSIERSVRITPEGAFVVALLPYLAALRIALWFVHRALARALRLNVTLDPLDWMRLLARAPLRLSHIGVTEIWGRWFFPQRTNRVVAERAIELARQQQGELPMEAPSPPSLSLKAPPLMNAADTAELTENHGLTFESSTRWRGHLETPLPLDTDYWLEWCPSGYWSVRVAEPGLLARGRGSACWSEESSDSAQCHWHPEQALPGTAENAVAFSAAFLAFAEQKHREWGKPMRGSFFTKRRPA